MTWKNEKNEFKEKGWYKKKKNKLKETKERTNIKKEKKFKGKNDIKKEKKRHKK